ncbi:MAG: response regulator [Rhodoferax sp.]|nr:response regulator [Rhodoferax sp.]
MIEQNQPAPPPAQLPTVLCVDDEPNILSALKRLFRGKGWQTVTADGGSAALALLETQAVDLVISDMRMPEMDGAQLLTLVRQRWPDTLRLLLTGHSDISAIIEAINRGEIYRYITKPWDDNDIVLIVRQGLERKTLEQEKQRLEVLTAQQNLALKELNASLETKVEARTSELRLANEQLKANFVTTIKVFSTLLEMRGGNLSGHSRRVADLARRLALRLELDGKLVQQIFVAGLLHEIGKIGFSDELLNTPVAMMTPEQMAVYRKHPMQAELLLLPLPDLREASEIITTQFERFDGSGFPANLAGDAIAIGARILSLTSDYDNMQIGALTQAKLKPEEAKVIVLHSSGKRYDPTVVTAFLALFEEPKAETLHTETIKEVALAINELQPGMVLSRDLITPSGMLMLSAGHQLDARLIGKIASFLRMGGTDMVVNVRQDSIPPAEKPV